MYGGAIYSWQYAPKLNVFSSNAAVVTWPDSAYTNIFALQTNADVNTTNWVNVSLPVNDDGTNKSVTLPAPANNLFFRLLGN